jgi:hypothetical protein
MCTERWAMMPAPSRDRETRTVKPSVRRVVAVLAALSASVARAQGAPPPAPAPESGPRAPGGHGAAAGGGASLAELAKQIQNPLADLVSVPFQNNFNGGGPNGSSSYNLNFQPVIPIELDETWNLVLRPIVPFYNVPVPGTTERSSGLGEIILETFFSPAKSTGFIWGVGPAVSFPTATNEAVSTGCFAAGPVVALVYMEGPWVVGALLTQLDAFARMGSQHLDVTSLQVFLNYNLPKAWAIGTAPTFVQNWNLHGTQLLVPVGAAISKTVAIARLPMSLSLSYYANVVHPEGQPPWLLRMVVTFMFPK